jgi:hypothetical protein
VAALTLVVPLLSAGLEDVLPDTVDPRRDGENSQRTEASVEQPTTLLSPNVFFALANAPA